MALWDERKKGLDRKPSGLGRYETFSYEPVSWEKARQIAEEVRRQREGRTAE